MTDEEFKTSLGAELDQYLNPHGIRFVDVQVARHPRGGYMCEVRVVRGPNSKTGHFLAKDFTPAARRAVTSAAVAYFLAFMRDRSPATA